MDNNYCEIYILGVYDRLRPETVTLKDYILKKKEQDVTIPNLVIDRLLNNLDNYNKIKKGELNDGSSYYNTVQSL